MQTNLYILDLHRILLGTKLSKSLLYILSVLWDNTNPSKYTFSQILLNPYRSFCSFVRLIVCIRKKNQVRHGQEVFREECNFLISLC